MRCGNGGFLKVIYDGYSEYIFEKPFSNILKKWGAKKISRIVDTAKNIYKKNKGKIKEPKTEKELSDLRSEITDFEMLNNEYMVTFDEETTKIKEYIEKNINEFAYIDETNSQNSSDFDHDIKELEDRKRIIEELEIIGKYIEDHKSKFVINDENDTFAISESEIFGKDNTLISGVITQINGKSVNIKIKKRN
jgi:hypothetical protein